MHRNVQELKMLKTLLAGLFLTAIPVSAMATPQMTCTIIADFSSAEEAARWSEQNDNVMGGRSTGGPSFEAGHLTFAGFTNMDGGGFSSIRTRGANKAFAEADAVRLTLKPDERNYQLSFRTTARDRWGRAFAFRAPIPQTPAGEWTTVTIALADLSASIWGRSKDKSFDRTTVTEYGLFIYDGITGPFSLEVKTIEACKSEVKA